MKFPWSIRERLLEAERRSNLMLHEESLAIAKDGTNLQRSGNRLQKIAIVIAVLGILTMTVIAWAPWSKPAPVYAAVRILQGTNAIIPSPIISVSVPPRYPSQQSDDHCGRWWNGWFQSEDASALKVPTVEISAPVGAAAAVVSATVRVFHSSVPHALSTISCVSGAGPSPGTLLNVDLDRPNALPTIVSDDGSNVALSVPNAVISIPAGQTEYVAITPTGSKRWYEWSVSLDVVVNQQTTSYAFGNLKSPLMSWLGPMPAISYDFDFASHSWRQLH